MKSLLSRFREDESGAIEYSLIGAGIAVLTIIAVTIGKLVSFVP
jgi:Flp pilus assembly pilin Flp